MTKCAHGRVSKRLVQRLQLIEKQTRTGCSPQKGRLAGDDDLGINILYCLPSPYHKTGEQKAGAYNCISFNGNNVFKTVREVESASRVGEDVA